MERQTIANSGEVQQLVLRKLMRAAQLLILWMLIVACVAGHLTILMHAPSVVTHWNDSAWYLSQANFFLGGNYYHEPPILLSSRSSAFSTYMAPGYGFLISVFVRVFGDSWQLALAIFQHLCVLGAKIILVWSAFVWGRTNFLVSLVAKLLVMCFCFMPLTFVLPSTVMSESVALALLAIFLCLTWRGFSSGGGRGFFLSLAVCCAALLFFRGEKLVTCIAICLYGVLLTALHRAWWRRMFVVCAPVAIGLITWAAVTMVFTYQQHGIAQLSTGTGRHLYNKFIGELKLHEGANLEVPCLSAASLPRYWWDEGAYPTALRCKQTEAVADDILKDAVTAVMPRIRLRQIFEGTMVPLRNTVQNLKTDKLLASELDLAMCCRLSLSIFEKLTYRSPTFSDLTIPGLSRFTYLTSTILFYGLYVVTGGLALVASFGRGDKVLLALGLLCIATTASKLFLETVVTRHLIEMWYVVVFWAAVRTSRRSA